MLKEEQEEKAEEIRLEEERKEEMEYGELLLTERRLASFCGLSRGLPLPGCPWRRACPSVPTLASQLLCVLMIDD